MLTLTVTSVTFNNCLRNTAYYSHEKCHTCLRFLFFYNVSDRDTDILCVVNTWKTTVMVLVPLQQQVINKNRIWDACVL